MALSCAGRTEEVHDLGAGDEVELCERQNPLAVEGRLEGEVEALEGLHGHQPGRGQRDGDAAVLADAELLAEQRVDGLEGADLALLEALHGVIERLERAGHAQAHQVCADALQHRAHARPPAASRWPTLS